MIKICILFLSDYVVLIINNNNYYLLQYIKILYYILMYAHITSDILHLTIKIHVIIIIT